MTAGQLWLPMAGDDGRSRQSVIHHLLVDDDAFIAMSSVGTLEDLGHRLIEATSGHPALEILAQHHDVDLMIMDFSMPGMNGAELGEAGRALRPRLPALEASEYADLRAGVGIDLPRLRKPYTQQQLQKRY